MIITDKQRDLIYNVFNYLINDACVINWTSKNHLNLEDYIDRYEDLED